MRWERRHIKTVHDKGGARGRKGLDLERGVAPEPDLSNPGGGDENRECWEKLIFKKKGLSEEKKKSCACLRMGGQR